jgi:hypothetical protein
LDQAGSASFPSGPGSSAGVFLSRIPNPVADMPFGCGFVFVIGWMRAWRGHNKNIYIFIYSLVNSFNSRLVSVSRIPSGDSGLLDKRESCEPARALVSGNAVMVILILRCQALILKYI